jgi:hypothetical protein
MSHEMRRSPLPLAFTLAAALAASAPFGAAAAPVTVGAAVDVAAATPIADILATPADWEGKTVRVEGDVTSVCTFKGCWMDVADAAGHSLRVKVEDGVVVFPADSVGKPAVVQGKVTVEELTRERWIAWHEHLASEGGAPFDASEVGEGPFQLVQIAGSGAAIGD